MRTFEIATLAFCILCILALSAQFPKLQKILLGLCLLSLGSHLWIEGWRWQMIPAYVSILVLLFLIVKQNDVSGVFIGTKLLLLITLTIPLIFLPVPTHPEITGEFEVGTFTKDISDPTTGRILPTKFWFPIEKPSVSDTVELQHARWLQDHEKIGPVLAKLAAMPGFIFNHLRHFNAGYHAEFSQSLSNDKPLVILSHGRGGFKEMNSFMAMEFASQGYVVIAPDHVKGSLVSFLADGTKIPFEPKEFAEGENLPDAQYDIRIRELGQRWTKDLLTITSQVKVMYPQLSSKKIISGGHSTGGGTAIEFCNQSEQCIGAIVLDAWMLPIAENTLDNIHKPLLSFFGDSRLKYFEPINRERFERLQQSSNVRKILNKEFVIAKADHLDFCDAGLLSPYSYLFGQRKGRIKTQRVMEIINQHSLNYVEALYRDALPSIQWKSFPEEMDWGYVSK